MVEMCYCHIDRMAAMGMCFDHVDGMSIGKCCHIVGVGCGMMVVHILEFVVHVVLKKTKKRTKSDQNRTKNGKQPSSPNSYSSGSTTPQNHQSGTSISGGCSNGKHLLGKIKVLEAAVEMHMHPEQHTRNSTLLLHELYNDMDNLGLE
nr:hypothetical protein [Tanacetum cinerariifolium]